MPYKKKFRCLNCGARFELDYYTPEEQREERRRRDVHFGQASCPECKRIDYREGWE